MPDCRQCGAPLDANVRFCLQCGAVSGDPAERRPIRCPNCGLFNPPGTERCDCGLALEEATSAEAAVVYRRIGLWNIGKGAVILLVGFAGIAALVGAVVKLRDVHLAWHIIGLVWTALVVTGAALITKGVRQRWPPD